jgi:hypothetical protein
VYGPEEAYRTDRWFLREMNFSILSGHLGSLVYGLACRLSLTRSFVQVLAIDGNDIDFAHIFSPRHSLFDIANCFAPARPITRLQVIVDL